nr:MAG TPA: hypothetical protein [Ackermannviridae sp.]
MPCDGTLNTKFQVLKSEIRLHFPKMFCIFAVSNNEGIALACGRNQNNHQINSYNYGTKSRFSSLG